jgi:hypothetical protein
MFVYVVLHRRTRAVAAVIQAPAGDNIYAVLADWFASYRRMTSLPNVALSDFELDAAIVRDIADIRAENARQAA